MIVNDIHNILFNAHILFSIALGVWSVTMAVRNQPISGNFWGSLATITILATTLASAGNQRRNDVPRGPLARKIDGWIYDAKVKLGIIQPRMLMGEIAIVPPPAPNSTTSGPAK